MILGNCVEMKGRMSDGSTWPIFHPLKIKLALFFFFAPPLMSKLTYTLSAGKSNLCPSVIWPKLLSWEGNTVRTRQKWVRLCVVSPPFSLSHFSREDTVQREITSGTKSRNNTKVKVEKIVLLRPKEKKSCAQFPPLLSYFFSQWENNPGHFSY